MYLYYYSCIVKRYTLSSQMCLYWYFVNFLVSLNCGSVSVLGRQHICKQHWEEGDSECWVRATHVFLMEQMRFLRGCDEQSVTWWKWKNLLQEIKCFAATCFCSRIAVLFRNWAMLFFLFTSFLIGYVTCEKEVHRWSSSFEPNHKNNM